MKAATKVRLNQRKPDKEDSCLPRYASLGLVSWCFEPSQPQRIISGLKTNINSKLFCRDITEVISLERERGEREREREREKERERDRNRQRQTDRQTDTEIEWQKGRKRRREREKRQLVSWCFELSKPPGITSGLNANCNLSLRYSAHKSFNTNRSITYSTVIPDVILCGCLVSKHQLTHLHSLISTTHTHTHIFTNVISTEPQSFCIPVEIFLYTKFTSTPLILYRTYQSLSWSQNCSPDSHFGTVSTKISPKNISL